MPLLDKNDQTSFDYKTFNQLVDTFLEKGFTYFDTASFIIITVPRRQSEKRCVLPRTP
ncbi:MAG: hypothetical protein ACM3NT_01070 [Methylocystaceae bacterium]